MGSSSLYDIAADMEIPPKTFSVPENIAQPEILRTLLCGTVSTVEMEMPSKMFLRAGNIAQLESLCTILCNPTQVIRKLFKKIVLFLRDADTPLLKNSVAVYVLVSDTNSLSFLFSFF